MTQQQPLQITDRQLSTLSFFDRDELILVPGRKADPMTERLSGAVYRYARDSQRGNPRDCGVRAGNLSDPSFGIQKLDRFSLPCMAQASHFHSARPGWTTPTRHGRSFQCTARISKSVVSDVSEIDSRELEAKLRWVPKPKCDQKPCLPRHDRFAIHCCFNVLILYDRRLR